jgi:Zn-dependent peptidase ImmA (M78 family)/transcriptional regulator with XRE-family HTH domain
VRTENVNPAMIVLARESRGMSARELCEITGISTTKLSKYENAILPVSPADLASIAAATKFRHCLFWQHERLIGLGSSLLFNRRLKTTPVGVQRQVQARVNMIRIQMERLLRAAEVSAAARLPRIDIDECNGDARLVARRVRAALRIPMGPVPSMTQAIESIGGLVVLCNFDAPQVDGAHIWIPGSQPMFFMSADRPGDRHRFNLAHELGHAVMHEIPTGDIERQANEFAAEFLMPADEIRPELSRFSIERAAVLKQRWRVSMSALIYNAHALGCISDSRRVSMYATLRSMLSGMEEPIHIAREEPTLVRQLVQLHRSGLGYTDEEMRELFMMDDNDFMVLPEGAAIGPKPLHRVDAAPLRFEDFRRKVQ